MSIQQCNRWYSLGLCGWFFLPLNQSSSRICKRHTYAVQSFSDHEWDSIVSLCVSSVRMCVYCKCRLEFRVQLEMDTVNHVGLLLIPPPTRPTPPAPPLPPPPPYLSIQSTDINTDLYSFAACELQPAKRRETGQKGQERTERIRLSRLSAFCLLPFCFCSS